ncbi:MAG: hypothetical protein CVV45_10540 [Spirochaetae bacterium HGW-Spirochaetae-10]|nr:MAG: hypothetical protein CVV45_10540 [Spirochaetae bacterium HGW-Spirochaetae-10]
MNTEDLKRWQQLASERTDRQLYEILSRPDDYQPEALNVYRTEFRRRNLDEAQLERLTEATQSNKVIRSAERLSYLEKIWILLNPFSLLRLEKYRYNGQEGKYNEAYRYVGIGIVMYAILFGYILLDRFGYL